MKSKHFQDILNSIDQNKTTALTPQKERILLIDSFNLFFRNFSILNMVNPYGNHIGGVGGFLRSLGSLTSLIQPTQIYTIFDGEGSTINRKNILSGYKSGRNINKITNSEIFKDREEEDESKINQLVRIIQYLKTLPIKILSLDRTEADDVIAQLCKTLSQDKNNEIYIISVDKDFIQLISDNVFIYNPISKEIYNQDYVLNKYGLLSKNFIIYKTLIGDNSDKIKGIKGLGNKGILKKFPELKERILTLEEIYEISKNKFKEHLTYARIIQEYENLKKSYKIMNLDKPMLGKYEEDIILKVVESKNLNYIPQQFIKMYNEDQIGKLIKNVEIWLDINFKKIYSYGVK